MVIYPAPAKLNLFLHIIGRRADGYHELQTLFQFLDFGDELTFWLRKDGSIQRSNAVPGVGDQEDLALRAAQLLQESTGCRLGCDIGVEKRIPLGGGLGGGSSDAATTLLALNRLWQLNQSPDQLAALGLRLGADVPVFVHGKSAWAEGVGEKLTPTDLPQPWYLVVTPPCTVNTREVFQAPELPRNSPRVTWADFEAGKCRNDFEAVVRARYPLVAQALDWLGGKAPARLSGSGASVFAQFPSEAQARNVSYEVPPGWRSIVARGLNRSPAHLATPL